MNVGWRERNQKDATNLMFIIKLYLNMFRASLCPSSGEQECALPHTVFCTAGTRAVCTVKVTVRLASRTVTFTVHTACVPAAHSHSHHYQCRTPYAAVHTLVLLMMGIMMPETCWDKVWNKHQISCILLVSLSSPLVVEYWNKFGVTSNCILFMLYHLNFGDFMQKLKRT